MFGYTFHDVAFNTVNTTATVTIAPAAGEGRRNYLISFFLVANDGVTVSFVNAGDDGAEITGPIQMAANVPLVIPFSPVGIGATAVNTALNMTLNTTTQVSGSVAYLPWF